MENDKTKEKQKGFILFERSVMITIIAWTVAMVMFGGRSGVSAAPSFTITRDGQPAVTIVLAAEPTRSAQFAAAELQYHIGLLTGATLSVVNDDGKVTGATILVAQVKRPKRSDYITVTSSRRII